MKYSRHPLLYWPSYVYIEFFRTTPPLVQIVWLYYGPRLRDRHARAPADRAACRGRDLPPGRDAHHRRDTLFRCDLPGCAAGRSAGTPLQGGASIGQLMTEALIAVERLVKRYGASAVLDDINLEVMAGQVLVVIGPSGSGKSTLLRCLAALEPIQRGAIRIDGTLAATGEEEQDSGRNRAS